MRRKQHTDEQIIGILKEHEAGLSAQELIRKHGISNGTFYRWKSKYSCMEVSEAKRLRELESENAKLKKLLAEMMLEKTAIEVSAQPCSAQIFSSSLGSWMTSTRGSSGESAARPPLRRRL